MKRISVASLALAVTLAAAHAQHALPPGYPPELYIDQWGQAHWIWHDWQDVPHVSAPMPPPQACYDDHGHYVGGPGCAGPSK